ncbi:hypothetical protein C6496_03105 [Candidatus Poribacteria bacterium]|nr:MAG: hypothetical protein C6496_03105 [Candidatus Poribacteria bacterium]
MEDKIVEISEDEKRFLQISMDPSDDRMLKANVRFINIDDVKQCVIIGPVTHNLVGIDLNQPEITIDETQYKRYKSLLDRRMFVFDLHILLKNGEIISRTYLDTMMDELMKIEQCLSANSVIIDDPSIVRLAKAKLKFCVRTAEFKEPDGRTLKYREVEIDGEVDLDDGKVMLISKVLDVVRDIFRIPHSDKDESK